MFVLDREGVHTCPKDRNYDLEWPETAPDTDYVQDCPKEYTGIVTRKCLLKDGKNPIWGIPDFSQCTSRVLGYIYRKVRELYLSPVILNSSLIISVVIANFKKQFTFTYSTVFKTK